MQVITGLWEPIHTGISVGSTGEVTGFRGRLPAEKVKDEIMAAVRQLDKQDMLFVAGETDVVYQHTAGLVILDASEWPHEIDVPTAIVCTEQDRAIPPEHQREIAELITGSELFSYDEGHLACMDPEFGEELARACSSVSRRLGSQGMRRA